MKIQEIKQKLKEAEASGSGDLKNLKIQDEELRKQEEEFRRKEEELIKKERVSFFKEAFKMGLKN